MFFPRAIPIAALLVVFVGCDERSSSTSATTSAPPPVKVEHAGTIGGRVLLAGKLPALPRVAVTGDAHCTGLHPDGVPDESVVVAGDGGLANVFVYLKGAPASDGAGREPAMIDQIVCQYVPHAVAVQVNQTLRVKSSDPVLHNVHVIGENNPPLNLAEVKPGEQTVRFAQPDTLRVRCDVHQWMKAIVRVFDNPYFAVSGADGKFEIKGVPPGEYTLAAWHERFGELTQKVTVAPDGSMKEDFTYKP
jgi:plastocyanin